MASFIALLRGINVGGHGIIPMAELREFLEALGYSKVKTLLQSGNVVFQAKPKPLDTLELFLEKKATARWQGAIDFHLRDTQAWQAMIAANPFPRDALDRPGHLFVMCFKSEPAPEKLAALKAALNGPEYFEAHGRELYLVYPDGMGTSRFSTALIERKLGLRGTARNWNTVQKIAALLASA